MSDLGPADAQEDSESLKRRSEEQMKIAVDKLKLNDSFKMMATELDRMAE